MLEGWFKADKEDEFKKRTLEEQERIDTEVQELQALIDTTVENQQKLFELTNKKLEASQVPDDQELNNAGMAHLLGKYLEKAPLLAHEAELNMKVPSERNSEDTEGYITKN